MTDAPGSNEPSETSVSIPRASKSDSPDPTRDQVMWALRQVWDPELALDIVSLGLVYDVRVDGNHIDIDMTLTTPGCPVSETLPQEAEAAVQGALPGFEVHINIVWDPPWTPERLSEEALEALGYRG